MNSMTNDATPWYTHRWPWLLMAGPAVVLVAGVVTSYLAFSRQDALVVGDYYKKGKAINQDLRRDRAAAALGLQLDLGFDPESGVLHGRLTGKQALAGRLVSIRLLHATQPAHDLQLLAQIGGDGGFALELPMLERSRWQVLVEGQDRSWRLEGVWQWPLQRAVALRAGD